MQNINDEVYHLLYNQPWQRMLWWGLWWTDWGHITKEAIRAKHQ